MELNKIIYHANDRVFKYARIALNRRLHEYFNLPGKYVMLYPTTIITKQVENLEMDDLHLVDIDGEKILINVEQQSGNIDEEKIETICKYRDYSKTNYGFPVLTVIIISIDPKNSIDCYEYTKTDIIKPIYIYIPPKEIEKKLNNLRTKVSNNIELNEKEALDIAFIPLFLQKNNIEETVIELYGLYKKAMINDVKLKT